MSIRKAEHKIYQLNIAHSLNLMIPKTVVTNDPAQVRDLFYSCARGIIIKPLYLGFISHPQSPQMIFTSAVSEADLDDIDSVRCAPSIFQERVEKDFDVRVTVVGERVFSAQIKVDSLPPNIPDWRFAPLEKLKHSVYDLPRNIEKRCLELVKLLGLDFGAIDLAVDRDGNHIFFEINPNGQWAWLETVLNFPISQAIVDRLSDPYLSSG
jgi:glutathione synthase/RimK-type ligase-like ATP-grasp enzyme